MSILNDIVSIQYLSMEALCDFSDILKKAIKDAVSKTRHQFEAEWSVLKYWDRKKDNSIVYGSFFPKAAGDTELKYWAGLHWKKDSEDTHQPKIVFYVYVPVNLLFLCSKIASRLKESAKNATHYDLYPFSEYAVVMTDQEMSKLIGQSVSNDVLQKSLTNFIAEVLKDLKKLE